MAKQNFKDKMPIMYRHKGEWQGDYTHLSTEGEILDQHSSHVTCTFPDEGQYAYIQYNHFTWPDGHEEKVSLPGVLKGDKLWWDTPTFHGCAWETGDNMIMLDLERYDDPGARFYEVIIMGDSGNHRARTWHWFKDGKLFKRTLCNEYRVK